MAHKTQQMFVNFNKSFIILILPFSCCRCRRRVASATSEMLSCLSAAQQICLKLVYANKGKPENICCMLSFGWFPGVWILYADVSEHSVFSIFMGRWVRVHAPTCLWRWNRLFRNVGI